MTTLEAAAVGWDHFPKGTSSPAGAAATGWTVFVFPPHAAGFKGGEGQRWERGSEGGHNKASLLAVFSLSSSPPLPH